MKRKFNTWWEVISRGNAVYCGRKHGWLTDDEAHEYNRSTHHSYRTREQAIRSLNQLKTRCDGNATVSQVTFKHGVRLFRDWEFYGDKKCLH